MSTAERSLALPAELSSVRIGRHFARDVLQEWDLAQLIDDVSLCVSELVTNAVRHARTALTLTISRDTTVIVAVADGDAELHRPFGPQLDVTADHGRGLQIVAAISDDWGVAPAATGKTVWFELSLPRSGSLDADVFSMSEYRDQQAAVERVVRGGESIGAEARVAN